MRFLKFLVFVLLVVPALAVASQDADFLAARDAFRVGDVVKLDRMAMRLKHSPLEPYLAYYQLRLRLETASATDIQAFLARPDDTPLINQLRAEWLRLLGKRQQWEEFAVQYPLLVGGEVDLTCYGLQSRQRLQEEQVLHEARNLWLTSSAELPESCAPLFDAAIASGIINATDIWLRLRLALEAGNLTLAKQLSEKLPAKRALSSAELDSAATDQVRYLATAKLDNASEAQRTVAMFALQRLAKQSPQLAYSQWEKKAAYFTADEQYYFYGWLGYEAARKRDARALEWYKAAGEASLAGPQLAWRARAALLTQNWHEVWASINAMTPQQQREGVWRYWKARALKAWGSLPEANVLFAELSNEHNFYGQLAAEEIGVAPAATIPASYQPSKATINAMLAQPAVQRTLALYRMDLRTDAAREWAWAARKLDDQQLLVAAEIARRNGMYDHAINTADRTVQIHDFSLRYLAPYRDVLQGYIRKNELEEAWVYGLIRQESRFVYQAKSPVGATGLMQIMPATARWIAQKIGMKSYRQALVNQLDTHFKLGTYYMKTVLSSLDNSPVLASAAYNAGPARARKWRGESALEGAVYAENIPFDETRNYVKKVMSNTMYYSQLFGQPPRSLKQRLGVITAKNAVNQQAIPDER
ncbi:MAG: transglycosylase SLT domain-containing protein [Nitrosomonadales bacterium]|nr:transglycosylase SLT domain-containing protein [Nitrosomonadales bacterium]